MISSITYFLSFIALLEGGLGAVVLAELYKPLEDRDDDRIKGVLIACKMFFRWLGYLFIGYVIILSILYPFFFAEEHDFRYVSSLIIIMCISTLAQYMFSITTKILLQAQQKVYIVNYISTAGILLNVFLTIAIVLVYPDIHAIKLFSGLVFLLQPVILNQYVEKKYRVSARVKSIQNRSLLPNRWSGFAQNLAHFITTNTPVMLITGFSKLTDVSIYTVYMLAINALKSIITSVAISFQSALGKYYVQDDKGELNRRFLKFETLIWAASCISFGTCLLLINSFVKIYTIGVNDAEYYHPTFAVLIVFANMIYCIREPYRLLILSAGKFKETNWGAFLEAVINFGISIILLPHLGLVGIALGSLCAMLYRTGYVIWYLKKDILTRKYREYMVNGMVFLIMSALNLITYKVISFDIDSVISFLLYGTGLVVIEALMYYIIHFLVRRITGSFKAIRECM